MLIRHTVCRLLEKLDSKSRRQSTDSMRCAPLNTFRPAVIFIDLEMPKMNGHQFIEFLNARPDTHDIPIVVLSAKRSPDEPRADICMKKDADIHPELRKVLELTLPTAKHRSGHA